MASFLTASLVCTLLVFRSMVVSADQRILPAKHGEDVILPCRAAENKHLEAAKWMKTNQSLCIYRINSFGENRPECSNSRADLLDVENRDVSLVLKNVKTDDTGTYECWIKETTNNRRKRSVQDYKLISIVNLRVEPDQRTITAEPGKNVILTCREVENKQFEAAKWMKTNQSLCVYEITSFGENKPECSNSRADLDVKNRDVSLVLKNVTTDDGGTYECWIKETTNNRRKRSIHDYELISTVKLEVGSGNKEKQKEDGGNKGGPKEDGGSKTGPIAGLSVFAVAVVVGGVAAVFYKRSRDSSLKSKRPPPAAADAEKKLTGPDE